MDEERLLDGLISGPDDAEYQLDLGGLDIPHATESVRQMLERNRFRDPRTILVTLGDPFPGGPQNLFQPIGRQLLEAKRGGIVDSMKPITTDYGPGYWIRTVGKETAPAEKAPVDPSES